MEQIQHGDGSNAHERARMLTLEAARSNDQAVRNRLLHEALDLEVAARLDGNGFDPQPGTIEPGGSSYDALGSSSLKDDLENMPTVETPREAQFLPKQHPTPAPIRHGNSTLKATVKPATASVVERSPQIPPVLSPATVGDLPLSEPPRTPERKRKDIPSSPATNLTLSSPKRKIAELASPINSPNSSVQSLSSRGSDSSQRRPRKLEVRSLRREPPVSPKKKPRKLEVRSEK